MAPLSPASLPYLIEEDDSCDEFRPPQYPTLNSEFPPSRTTEDVFHYKEFGRRRRRRHPPLASPPSSSSSNDSLGSEQTFVSSKIPGQDVPLTTTLPLLVFIDMFAVALVVPLLFHYYQSTGVASAGQRELLSSIFSLAQIVGGILLGAFMDAQWLRRRTVLFVSFGGSAVAYALIAYGSSLSSLVFSRVLVGLVKQTMTITKTMLTRCTTESTRAQHMGRLSASATAAWVVGPSVGAVLFKYADSRAPAALASGLFLVNMALAAVLLPEDDNDVVQLDTHTDRLKPSLSSSDFYSRKGCSRTESGTLKTTSSIVSSSPESKNIAFSLNAANLQSCFSSRALGSLVCASLVVTWVARATNSNNLSRFYEDLYGLEPHYRGYISSYQQVLGFFAECFFITPLLVWIGGERRATCLCSILLSLAIGLQSLQSTNLTLFLGLVVPFTSLAYSVMFTSLQTLVTTVAPVESIFSVLAAMDVLQNVVSVTVPFYRTMLFFRLARENHHVLQAIDGDPDPTAWLYTCTIHWAIAALALSLLLLSRRGQCHKSDQAKDSKTE